MSALVDLEQLKVYSLLSHDLVRGSSTFECPEIGSLRFSAPWVGVIQCSFVSGGGGGDNIAASCCLERCATTPTHSTSYSMYFMLTLNDTVASTRFRFQCKVNPTSGVTFWRWTRFGECWIISLESLSPKSSFQTMPQVMPLVVPTTYDCSRECESFSRKWAAPGTSTRTFMATAWPGMA